MLPRRDVRGTTTSTVRNQRGYILSSVVVLSIVIFSTIVIVLQYVSAVSSSLNSNIRQESANEVANEQLRKAMNCAEDNGSHASCGANNVNTGTINGQPSLTSTAFGSASDSSIEATTTTRLGNTSGLNDSVTLKARAPLVKNNLQSIDTGSIDFDDSEIVVQMTAGAEHTCARTSLGRLFCWGNNAHGQLGINSYTSSSLPVPVSLANVKDVSAGLYHTCAVAGNDSRVYCWGRGNHGQLGNGAAGTYPYPVSTSPAQLNATSVSAGGYHTCSVNTTKQLRCWGNNTMKQVGTGSGTPEYINTPHLVSLSPLVNDVQQVSAGLAHNCVILSSNSRVYCWGLSEQGAAGGFGYTSGMATPYLNDGGRQYRSVSAGHWHTCGTDLFGQMRCWGYNHNGQLGASRPIANVWGPAPTNTPPASVTVIDSYAHNCALSGGDVYCWGNPADRRIGNGGSNVWAPYRIASLQNATAIAAGDRHSCAAVNGGKQVRCWGDNTSGQFGNGATSTTDTSTPQSSLLSLQEGTGDRGISASSVTSSSYGASTCVLRSGAIFCWGLNTFGQLGDGTTTWSKTPVEVKLEGKKAIQVKMSSSHTCAILEGGDMSCWGSNSNGQLGDGTTIQRNTPVPVNLGGQKVAHINVGSNSTCAVLESGEVLCWGINTNGQLGDGTTTDRATPAAVNFGGQKVVQISSSGSSHACAVLESGEARCWGWNYYGQLGDGTTIQRNTPVPVNFGGQKVVQISTIVNSTCAILESGEARCWGINTYGQLGDGTTIQRNTPVPVNFGGQKVVQIGGGNSHTCAILQSGEARCWGDNQFGKLGDGTTTQRTTPVAVQMGGKKAVQITGGTNHSCALLETSLVKCWGHAGNGQLGNTSVPSNGSPTPVSVEAPAKPQVTVVSSGESHSCAISHNKDVYCWGDNSDGQLGDGTNTQRTKPVKVQLDGQKVNNLSAGTYHTCAVLESGEARCWGYNGSGRLGNGNTSSSSTPVPVQLGGQKVAQISAARTNTCAVLESGEVRCWGSNEYGQLGNGTKNPSLTPVSPQLSGRAVQISTGWWHTCVVLDGGQARCWGYNVYGNLGDGSTTERTTPATVQLGGQQIVQISAATYHTCGVFKSGEVRCWGTHGTGRLGTGSTSQQVTPVTVPLGGQRAVQVHASVNHSCAVLANGGGRCWGYNNSGQIGNNATAAEQSLPASVVAPGNSGVTQISAGTVHTCGVVNLNIHCWGNNAYGQLGDNTLNQKLIPTAVHIEEVDYGNYLVF